MSKLSKRAIPILIITILLTSIFSVAIPLSADPGVTITSDDIQGPYVIDILQGFSVTTTSDTLYPAVIYKFVVEGATLSDITSIEYLEVIDSTWYPLPLTQVGANLEGDFGPSTGFPIVTPFDETSLFRIEFATAKTYPVTISLVTVPSGDGPPIATTTFSVLVVSDTIVLDAEYYPIGETVTVTVTNIQENIDPIRSEDVTVTAKSTTDATGIVVTLTETGPNTGIFTGTFPIVATVPEPGPDELGVTNGDTITVTYPGFTDTALVSSTIPPVADAGGPYSENTGVPINFDGTGSYDPDGTIINYAWDFGDGTFGTGATPSKEYTAQGTWTVKLTVTDNELAKGIDTTTATVPKVKIPPVADAGGPYSGREGSAISFDGSGSYDPDGTILTYSWDFDTTTPTTNL